MTRGRLLLLPLLAAAFLAPVLPATASGCCDYTPPHITRLHVGSIKVSDQSCQHIPVTVRLSESATEVDVGIYSGGRSAGELDTFPDGKVAYDYLQWCPDSGLGHYRAGPSMIHNTDSLGGDFEPVKDRTKTDFYVRRFSRLTASRSGPTVTAHLKAYSLTARTYTAVSGVVVRLMSSGRIVDSAKTSHGTAILHGSGGRVVAVPTATVAGSHTTSA